MKTVNSKVAFGFSIVNAGQRKAEYEPELVALSSQGGFRITPQVSAALGVQHGDNIMFMSTVNEVDTAIAQKANEFVSFCKEQGLDVDSEEAVTAFRKANYMWAIAKGILCKNSKGVVLTVTERLTKKDKIAYVEQNFDDVYASAMESASEEMKAALERDGITREEQVEILATSITGRELPKYQGSKCANSSGLTGVGTILTFTDTNVWNEMKSDLSEEEKGKINRSFSIDVNNVQKAVMSDGYEDVEVPFLVLGDYTDKVVARNTAGKEAENAAE